MLNGKETVCALAGGENFDTGAIADEATIVNNAPPR